MNSDQTDAIADEVSDKEPNVIWKPLPGSQTRFLTCPVFEALLEGTRGGGKTDALLMSFWRTLARGAVPADLSATGRRGGQIEALVLFHFSRREV
mgnify:CR=1 FL=1